MSNRYSNLFAKLDQNAEGGFIPFVTIADPDLETSYEIIKTLIDAGADALELGIPFSDPIADGPTIQAANIRALDNPIRTQDCLDLIRRIRDEYPDTPIGLLLYSNLVLAKGIEQFYQLCNDAGVDSVLVADVPVRESKPFRLAAEKANIDAVFIVPPNVGDETLRQVASYSRGYTYLLSRSGVTGAESQAEMPADAMIKTMKAYHAAPPILGFGISTPKQVASAIAAGAKGAISGSAVVKIIENNLNDKQTMLSELAAFVRDMKAATKR
ncbi:tryptophan synthase subunit alpha [Psychrosphaera sp. 1_MG-2023]|uniref:tryptophan synthase subunit alpha n=1 Tax=Psychrosphaera sp. 1_MG-2023 TaxID=3062643 RepID=UPI0026E27C77|nr:tryptophan synthase subunit alpha [Psychrosphaera sp. 1_MG-2023]MDO6718075.1 tryptophan synthase subunit alpha [Psychrosphaera sp. 1_MG-2023]